MEDLETLPGARRDNAGFVTVPAETLKPGCRGAACPAFARCQGRCDSKRALFVRDYAPYGERDVMLAG